MCAVAISPNGDYIVSRSYDNPLSPFKFVRHPRPLPIQICNNLNTEGRGNLTDLNKEGRGT